MEITAFDGKHYKEREIEEAKTMRKIGISDFLHATGTGELTY